VRVFISHAGPDTAWAEWIASLLAEAGFEVELGAWDWRTGDSFVARMDAALARADAMVAVFSRAYFEPGRWTGEEWQAALRTAKHRPRFLLPVRIDDTPAPPLLAGLITTSLHRKPVDAARRALLEAVRPLGRPGRRPDFPGGIEGLEGLPRLPGALPAVWGAVPPRNEAFVGRDALLCGLRVGLRASGRSVVQVLNGAGGIGKSQIAAEHAWRSAADYDAVWWVHAEQPDRIGDQYTAFACALGLVDPAELVEPAVQALRRYCRTRDRWLVVLDNAPTAADVRSWLLPGPGHVVVTSRDPAEWRQIAGTVPVDVFDRAESVALLRVHLPALAADRADRVADALGDLPLAVAQAAGVLAHGVRPEDYLALLAGSAADVLGEGRPLSYPVPLAAAVTVALDQVGAAEPAAIDLLRTCAVLGPAPIPVRWFTGVDVELSGEHPVAVARHPMGLRRIIGAVSRYGLAGLVPERDELVVHRLTRAIVRDHTPEADRATIIAAVTALMVQVVPDDNVSPATWPAWADLLPHLRAVDLPGTDDRGLARAAVRAVGYLLHRGDVAAGLELASRLHTAWSDRLGRDHEHTVWSAGHLATALRGSGRYREALRLDEQLHAGFRAERGPDDVNTLAMAGNLATDLHRIGEYERARDLNEDSLTRRCRVLGADHPDTLGAANNLALDLRALGERRRARDLDEDTLARRRRLLGDDHPDTLRSASGLALDLHELGEHARAREIEQDTLARRRRVLGDDHPDTLVSAGNLAIYANALGEHGTARELDEETLVRRRRVLGDDHPDTLVSASNLAADLRDAGKYGEARDLDDGTLARRRRVLGDDHPDTIVSIRNRALDLRLDRAGPPAGPIARLVRRVVTTSIGWVRPPSGPAGR
jgi:hypothetical protein